jgi:hypothetical protein
MGKFAQPEAGDRSKVLSVRLTHEEFEQLTELARQIGVGSSTLARTLIRRGLGVQGADLVFSGPGTPAVSVEGGRDADLESRVRALEKWVAQQA